jgi:hypothetical protein
MKRFVSLQMIRFDLIRFDSDHMRFFSQTGIRMRHQSAKLYYKLLTMLTEMNLQSYVRMKHATETPFLQFLAGSMYQK